MPYEDDARHTPERARHIVTDFNRGTVTFRTGVDICQRPLMPYLSTSLRGSLKVLSNDIEVAVASEAAYSSPPACGRTLAGKEIP